MTDELQRAEARYAEALADLRRFERRMDMVLAVGVSMVLTSLLGLVIPEGVVCVDLDACTVKGEVFGPLEPWAREIVERLDTFTEYSPSGTGVHVWLWGVKPGDKCRKGTVEIYGGPFGRYITCTGRGFSRWGEAPIAERTDAPLRA